MKELVFRNKDVEFLARKLEFTRKEIEVLAEKLDAVKPLLSEREQALLEATFAAARDHVSMRPEPEVAELKDEFADAFVRGEATDYVIQYRIGTDPPHPPPPPRRETDSR